MRPQLENLQSRMIEMKELYQRCYETALEVLSLCKQRKLEPGEEADAGYCLRQIQKFAKDIATDCEKKAEFIGRKLAIDCTKKTLQTMGEVESPRGSLSVAVPNATTRIFPPKPGSKEYHALCEALGIPLKVTARGLVTFKYPALVELSQQYAADGENFPDGVQTHHHFYCVFRPLTHSSKNE